MGTEVYHTLKGLIKAKYGIDSANVGASCFRGGVSISVVGARVLCARARICDFDGRPPER